MKENFETKKARILTKMALTEISEDIEKLKKFVEHPEIVGSINLAEVRRLNAKIKNGNPDEEIFETKKSFLFFFKGKYYQVQSGKLKKLSEAEAKTLLDKQPETKIYFICSGGAVCPMPGILSGKENMEAVEVEDDAAAAAFISEKSGITVKKEDL
jgi:hypothetical protein